MESMSEGKVRGFGGWRLALSLRGLDDSDAGRRRESPASAFWQRKGGAAQRAVSRHLRRRPVRCRSGRRSTRDSTSSLARANVDTISRLEGSVVQTFWRVWVKVEGGGGRSESRQEGNQSESANMKSTSAQLHTRAACACGAAQRCRLPTQTLSVADFFASRYEPAALLRRPRGARGGAGRGLALPPLRHGPESAPRASSPPLHAAARAL